MQPYMSYMYGASIILKTTFRKFKMGGISRLLYEVLLAAIYQAMMALISLALIRMCSVVRFK